MKTTRKENKEVEYYDKTYCDKCGDEIQIKNFDAFECELKYREGSSYPEGGSGDEWVMELCQKCAVRLVSLLTAEGYRVIHKEWDY